MTATSVCEVEYLGQVEYLQAWKMQDELAAEIGRGLRPPRLLLLEHPPTYTFGRKGKAEHLLWGEAELEQRGIQVHWVDRGGDVTYHGPGQLVGYPLIPLGSVQDVSTGRLPQADYLGYLRKLEATLVQALDDLGIQAHTIAGLTGVWVKAAGEAQTDGSAAAKIAAIGVKVDARGVSRHGFALNVNPQMEHWQGIIACGLAEGAVTSIEAVTGMPHEMSAVRERVARAFGHEFGFELRFV